MIDYSFDSSCSGYESAIFDDLSVSIASVIDGSFDIIELIVSTSSENKSGEFAVFGFSFEDGDFLRSDFLDDNFVSRSDFFGSRSAKSGEGSGSKTLAESSQLKFR